MSIRTAEQILNGLLGTLGLTLDQCMAKMELMYEGSTVALVCPNGTIPTIAGGLAAQDNVIALPGTYTEDALVITDASKHIEGTGPNCIFDFDITATSTDQLCGFYVAAGNTITVGSQTFTTTQATLIDDVMRYFETGVIQVPSTLAATPDDAQSITPQAIERMPGSDYDLTDDLPDGVVMHDVELFGMSGRHEAGLPRVAYTRQPERAPFAIPAPRAIAIVEADANDCWITNMANLSNMHPVKYAARKGCVINHGVIPASVGTTGYMTAANLITCMDYGNEILLHGDNSIPATQAAAITKWITGKTTLETLLAARGCRIRGTWGDHTIASAYNYESQLLRAAFEHSWPGSSTGFGSQWWVNRYRHASAFRFEITATTTTANIDAILASIPPMSKAIFVMHDMVNSGATSLQANALVYKQLIDGLNTMMANGDCVVTTLSGLHDCVLSPRPYYNDGTSNVACKMRWGGTPLIGDATTIPATGVVDGIHGYVMDYAGAAITLEDGDSGLWPWSGLGSGKILQIDTTTATSNPTIRMYPPVPVGYSGLMRFDAKITGAVTSKSIIPGRYGTTIGTVSIDGFAPSTSWVTYMIPFSVPLIELPGGGQLLLMFWDSGDNPVYQIDNVEVIQI